MFPCASFTIIIVDNQRPWLLSGLEPFCNFRNCASFVLIVIKSYIDITPFIIDGLRTFRKLIQGEEEMLTVITEEITMCQPKKAEF